MTYLTILDDKTIPALNECFNIVARPFISGLSNKETAFRRLRSIIRNEKLSDLSLKEEINADSNMSLAGLDEILNEYLGSEYLPDRLISLLEYYEYHLRVTGKLQNNNLNFSDMENALWKLVLIDKIIYQADYILGLSKRETLVNEKHNKEYGIFENTITTLISIIMSTEPKERFLEMLDIIGSALSGNSGKLLIYRMDILNYIRRELSEYNKHGKDEINISNVSFVEELLKRINSEEDIEVPNTLNWVDDIFLNHEGIEHISERTNFCLNMLAYLNYIKSNNAI